MLREQLKQEAIADATRDVEMAAEWFPLEEEASGIAVPRAIGRSRGSGKKIA
jgi:hypothetical protein